LRKGLVLITVLILSLIALIFVNVAVFVSVRFTSISGSEKRYRSALEYAKGVSSYLMEQMVSGNIQRLVNNVTKKIDVSNLSQGKYRVEATLLGTVTTPTGTVYVVEVEVTDRNSSVEKAVIDFGYEVY